MRAERYHDSPTDVLSDVREFGLGDAFWSRHTAIAAVCPDRSAESLLRHLANNCARYEPSRAHGEPILTTRQGAK